MVNFVIFLLVASWSGSTAELGPQGSRLAQSLGMLLGLPLDVEAPPVNSSSVPTFLLDIYNCWSSLRPEDSRAACLPGSVSKDSLEDVDEVQSIKATGEQQWSSS